MPGMRYATKADWAAAKARQLREEARLLPYVHSADWRGVRARCRAVQTISDHARRYERMAERFRAAGV